MTDYVKSTNFASKDSLATGNPLKIVKGTEIDTEFNNIATAVATKADIANPTFTGTPAAPTASVGTNTTQIATTAFVTSAITAYDTALTVSTSQIEDNAVTNAKMADLSVGTAELIDDSVTAAKILAGAVGTSELADAAVTTVKLLDSNVTPAKLSQPLTRGTAVASTSGTSIDFTGIPSWVKKISVILNGVSTNSISPIQIKIGTSSGIESTGYVSSGGYFIDGTTSSVSSSTTGFVIEGNSGSYNDPTAVRHGIITLMNISGNTWVAAGSIGRSGPLPALTVGSCGGSKTAAGVVDRISVTTVLGSNTFDAGSINIMYE